MEYLNPIQKMSNRVFDSKRPISVISVVLRTSVLMVIQVLMAYYVFQSQIRYDVNLQFVMFVISPIVAVVMVGLANKYDQLASMFGILYSLSIGSFFGILCVFFYDILIVVMIGLLVSFLVLGLLYLVGFGWLKEKSSLYGVIPYIVIVVILYNVMEHLVGFDTELLRIQFVVSSMLLSSTIYFLMIDFDMVYRYISLKAPKNYGWTIALGIVVSLVYSFFKLYVYLILALVTGLEKIEQ